MAGERGALTTGVVQYAHLLAAIGIVLRHSGHGELFLLAAGIDGGGEASSSVISIFRTSYPIIVLIGVNTP